MIRYHAPAKVNLCLKVTGRQPNGYNKFVSIAGFTAFGDYLFVRKIESEIRTFVTLSGPFAAALENTGDINIISAAAAALTNNNQKSLLQFHLEKNIPVGGGLAGGSSDAAACLRAISKDLPDPPSAERLHDIAMKLGADVPVCLKPSWQLMTGTGTTIQPVFPKINTPVHCVLANPGIVVSTKDVFDCLPSFSPLDEDSYTTEQVTALENGAYDKLIDFGNDLTMPACALHPEINALLDRLLGLSRDFPSDYIGHAMSGSGGSCFCLMRSADACARATQLLQESGIWATATKFI